MPQRNARHLAEDNLWQDWRDDIERIRKDIHELFSSRRTFRDVAGMVTQRAVLDALEAGYPMLRGTIRDPVTYQRRAFVRLFACEQDVSHEAPDTPLPDAVATGSEPLLVVGAMAGG